MTDPTEVFARPPQRTWWQHVEHALDRANDAYCALWDLMPALIGAPTLITLIALAPKR